MTAQVHVVQGLLSQKNVSGSVLRSGSIVNGRVIAKNGDGSYSVSLAGQKIDVRSETPLLPGQVFSARVKITGTQIALSLLQNVKSQPQEILQKFSASSQSLSPELSKFLSSLGFEPNAESFRILQFMQQLGMKIDVPAAKKALSHTQKKSASNGEYAQVSLLLEEKGIASDDEKVSAVLGQNERGQSDSKGSSRKEENPHPQKQHLASVDMKSLNSSVRDFFSQVDAASVENKGGILTAFNTVLSSSEKEVPLRHWIILPFEWNFASYSGDVRLLFDSELKNLEKVIINLKNESKKRIFVIYYKNNEPASVKFASDLPSGRNSAQVSKLFHSYMPEEIPIEEVDFDSLCGFCPENERISLLHGTV